MNGTEVNIALMGVCAREGFFAATVPACELKQGTSVQEVLETRTKTATGTGRI